MGLIITTFQALKDTMESYAEETGVTSMLPTFIGLAEDKIFRRLKGRGRWSISTSIETVAGTATIDKPDGFKGIVHMSLDMGKRETIHRANQDQAVDHYAYAGQGKPLVYVEHADTFELFPTPDSAYPVTLEFYLSRDPLSDSNTTNDILTNYPDLYLSMCMIEMYHYLRDWQAKREEEGQAATSWLTIEQDIIQQSAMGRPKMLLDRCTP